MKCQHPLKRHLTQDEITWLLALVHERYEYVDGQLIFKKWCGGSTRKGEPAGFIDTHGYMKIKIKGKTYMLAHIVWLIHTGDWPEFELDHRDRNKRNNRFNNLRPASRQMQMQNRSDTVYW